MQSASANGVTSEVTSLEGSANEHRVGGCLGGPRVSEKIEGHGLDFHELQIEVYKTPKLFRS